MVKPMLLVDTGITYEEANIQRWLLTKDTCPVTHKTLTSKQLKPNYAIQGLIAEWAQANKITLPPAPVCDVPLGVHGPRSGPSMSSAVSSSSNSTSCVQRGGVSTSYTAVTMSTTSSALGGTSYGNTTAAAATNQLPGRGLQAGSFPSASTWSAVSGDEGIKPCAASGRSYLPATSKCVVGIDEEAQVAAFSTSRGRHGGKAGMSGSAAYAMRRGRCGTSKTCWAVAAIVVVAVLGVVIGVAVYVSNQQRLKWRAPFTTGACVVGQ